jgi:hypothetical protein
VNEIATSTAATVNRWRIGRFLVYVGGSGGPESQFASRTSASSAEQETRLRVRKDKRGDTHTAQDKLSPRNCPRAERSTFKRTVWRLVSSSGRLPIVKQNRYNRQSRVATAVASSAVYSSRSARGQASRGARWVHSSLASVRHRISVRRIRAASNDRRWAIIRAVATARAGMIVHPVSHKAVTIDARKQVLRRAVVAAAGDAQR